MWLCVFRKEPLVDVEEEIDLGGVHSPAATITSTAGTLPEADRPVASDEGNIGC